MVSVFYLRAGYTPDDYPGAKEWGARGAMESCTAVSCPSVAYQLVGAKKIQQDLAAPGARLFPHVYVFVPGKKAHRDSELSST